MKHGSLLLLTSWLFSTQFASAQCTPNATYAGQSAGIYPGVSVNLPPVNIPEAYTASLTINTETDTAISVNVGGFPINAVAYISAMRINAVNGLPAGFTWATNQSEWNNGGAAPNFTPVQGCISITADAASVQQILQDNPSGGSFPLELVLDARIHSTSNPLLNSALSNTWLSDLAATVPGAGAQTITGYVLTVEPDITGMNEAGKVQISVYPNPANKFIIIDKSPNLFGEYAIYDLLGKQLQQGQLIDVGSQLITIDPNLRPGYYYLKINKGNGLVFIVN
jgi:hypothetical protein